MAVISQRLSKGSKACLVMIVGGLMSMICAALGMAYIMLLAPQNTPMPVWCLVVFLSGCVICAVGGQLESRVNSRRVAAEAIAKAQG